MSKAIAFNWKPSKQIGISEYRQPTSLLAKRERRSENERERGECAKVRDICRAIEREERKIEREKTEFNKEI